MISPHDVQINLAGPHEYDLASLYSINNNFTAIYWVNCGILLCKMNVAYLLCANELILREHNINRNICYLPGNLNIIIRCCLLNLAPLRRHTNLLIQLYLPTGSILTALRPANQNIAVHYYCAACRSMAQGISDYHIFIEITLGISGMSSLPELGSSLTFLTRSPSLLLYRCLPSRSALVSWKQANNKFLSTRLNSNYS